MAPHVYVLKYPGDEKAFAEDFLGSYDFTSDQIKDIAARINASVLTKKSDTIAAITRRIYSDYLTYKSPKYASVIIENLVARTKESVSVKIGQVQNFPNLADANELVTQRGSDQWYGPIKNPSDSDDAYWYIHPIYADYWEFLAKEDDEAKHFTARWLCFARLTSDTISLHWNGFTLPMSAKAAENSSARLQFNYWTHVPKLFAEIEDLARARVEFISLHNLIIYYIWDKYIDNKQYKWRHTRIRALSRGVSLNAHAGSNKDETDPDGILALAKTIRKNVQEQLWSLYSYSLPDPSNFDNLILQTLIREYGALSYGFTLKLDDEVLFSAHSYFGLKPEQKDPDSLVHMIFTYSKQGTLDQLKFLLSEVKESNSVEDYLDDGNSEHETIQMF